MSFQMFLASDLPMDEVENPHIELLSVNEAMEKGIKIPDFMLSNKSTIDRNKPSVMLWVDNEENLGEITIRNTEKVYLGLHDCNLETTLQHFSSLEWEYTEKRCKKLITYIKEHLEKANELEVWNLWIGYEDNVPQTRKHSVCADDLTPADLEKMFWCGQQIDDWQQYECLIVKRI